MDKNYYTLEPMEPKVFGSECLTNRKIQQDANIQSNWSYRQYMQQNALQIMKYNSMGSIYSSGNNPYTLFSEPVQNTPFIFASLHDNTAAPCAYPTSDLKQSYIEKIQLKSRLVAPSISTKSFY
jgi:hypothetical protein